MKIIEFQGGLGNQIFEYIYFLYLRKKYPNETFYSYFYDKKHWLHNGFELDKWFDVDIPHGTCFTNVIAYCCHQVSRILRHLPIKIPVYCSSDDYHLNEKKIFHQGWYQDKQYFLEVGAPSFKKDITVDGMNKELLELITAKNAVAVHVRRGDYLLPKNSKALGGICTPQYYERALQRIFDIVEKPHFFFFSDDTQYVMEIYKGLDKTIVNWNKGQNSFYDMYLMAHATNMILANSTFSCCAAYLNKNVGNVLCPPMWNKKINPDLNLDNWIVIEDNI